MEPEIDFPRGGAGVLTALEIRDVKQQAKQDVLFKDVRQSYCGVLFFSCCIAERRKTRNAKKDSKTG